MEPELSASFTTEDDTKIRVFHIEDVQGKPLFAAFCKPKVARDDEWVVLALCIGYDIDDAEALIAALWNDEEEVDKRYMLGLAVAFGVEWRTILQDPKAWAMKQDLMNDVLSKEQRDFLRLAEVGSIRHMANRLRRDRSGDWFP